MASKVKTRDDVILSTAGQVRAALMATYPSPEYALFHEVADATGLEKSRAIDCLVMSCWPSRGLSLSAIEIKVSRSDWLSELKNPAKAEAIAKHCDYFCIAAGSSSIVEPDEIPLTWGLMVPDGKGKMRTVIKPCPLGAGTNPISRAFLASILRNAADGANKAAQAMMGDSHAKGVKEGKAKVELIRDTTIVNLQRQLEEARASIKEFQDASGLVISSWHGNAKKVGEAVKFVLDGKLDDYKHKVAAVDQAGHAMLKVATEFRALMAKMDQEKEPSE